MKSSLKLFTFISILFITACTSPQTLVQYKSLGNSFASIELELKSNHKFILEVDPIADESDPEANNKDFDMKGKWKMEKNNYFLTFKGDVDLKSLFDPQYTQGKPEVNFIDEHTISFSTSRKTLTIWGVVCEIKKPNDK